jgi:hypothetical protein
MAAAGAERRGSMTKLTDDQDTSNRVQGSNGVVSYTLANGCVRDTRELCLCPLSIGNGGGGAHVHVCRMFQDPVCTETR